MRATFTFWKFIKNAKKYSIWQVFEKLKVAVNQRYQIGDGKYQNWIIQMRHLGEFSNNVLRQKLENE